MTSALVVLSHDHEPDEIATVLDAGADLFMSKPIVVPELVARVRALLRRKGPDTVWDMQAILEIDANQRVVRINDERSVQLTPVEFELLSFLIESDEEYHSARELLGLVWNYPEGSGDTALVRNHIRNLRSKLEDDPERPRIVESMPKRGYRINAQVKWTAAQNNTNY